jgi:hypothetical protein
MRAFLLGTGKTKKNKVREPKIAHFFTSAVFLSTAVL